MRIEREQVAGLVADQDVRVADRRCAERAAGGHGRREDGTGGRVERVEGVAGRDEHAVRVARLDQHRGGLRDVPALEHGRPEPYAVAVEGEQCIARAGDHLAIRVSHALNHERRGGHGPEGDLPERRPRGADRL